MSNMNPHPILSERIGDAAYHLEQTKEGPTLDMLDSWDAHASAMEAQGEQQSKLIQRLVDAWHTADGGHDMHKAISDAIDAGFKPTT